MLQSTEMKKDIIWNMAGSMAMAAASMLLSVFVMHVQGPDDGGIFAFGYSTLGQQMFIISYFGLRALYITDVGRRYSYECFRDFRRLTMLAAAVCSLLYLLVFVGLGKYSLYKAGILLLLIGWRLGEGAADLYESECQRSFRLWRGGREMVVRTGCLAAVFIVMLLLTRRLAISAIAGLAAEMAVVLYFRHSCLKTDFFGGGALAAQPSPGTKKALFLETLPLFLSVFLDYYVISAAKYAIDSHMTDADSGIFNLIFMPSYIIYVLANIMMRPYSTTLAAYLEAGDQKKYFRLKGRIAKLIGGISLAAVLLVLLVGRPVLRLAEIILGGAYQGMLTGLVTELAIIIAGGGLYALAALYYYIIIIKHRQKQLFVLYAGLTLLSFAMAGRLVIRLGLRGGAVCYLISCIVMCAGAFWLTEHEGLKWRS